MIAADGLLARRPNHSMFAIVDCNSFYCSCERLFRPDLATRPVVVLSNNDGCLISRTDEARQLGIGMAVPFYQVRDLIRRHGIEVFSSNYHLYGDMSHRVMDTLRAAVADQEALRVEVYSVDEAFVDMRAMPAQDATAFAGTLRSTVEQWTGIRVSVGVGPTRVLSKVANRLAKRDKRATGCVLVLDDDASVRQALDRTDVADLWGIGHRYATRLKQEFGITTAWQLRNMPENWARKQLGGVTGVRMIRELRGEPCLQMKPPLEKKEMIATTRMFGRPVYELRQLREAVATFVSRAAEKLRRQQGAAGALDVFVVTNEIADQKYTYNPATDHRYSILAQPTYDTAELIRHALPLVDQLYRPGLRYLKAGVVLSELVPASALQASLYTAAPGAGRSRLMAAIDNLNVSMRDDAVRFGATGLSRHWKMRQELRSRRFTTRWDELYQVS